LTKIRKKFELENMDVYTKTKEGKISFGYAEKVKMKKDEVMCVSNVCV